MRILSPKYCTATRSVENINTCTLSIYIIYICIIITFNTEPSEEASVHSQVVHYVWSIVVHFLLDQLKCTIPVLCRKFLFYEPMRLKILRFPYLWEFAVTTFLSLTFYYEEEELCK